MIDNLNAIGNEPDDLTQNSLGPTRTTPTTSPATSMMISLDDIVERTNYTRDLRPEHVTLLRDSIAEIGLEQPLVLIAGNQLVAGRHRYRAILELRDADSARFDTLFPGGLVPAQVFQQVEDSDAASVFALEMTENSARLNYTDEEVARAVEVLKTMDFTSKRGRPRLGDRPIGPAITKMFGMSEATMHRALAAARRGEKLSRESFSDQDKGPALDAAAQSAPPKKSRWSVPQEAEPEVLPADRITLARATVKAMTTEELQEFWPWIRDFYREQSE
jgi:hypothetical protein